MYKLARTLFFNYGKRSFQLARVLATKKGPPPKPTTIAQELLKKITIDAHINIISEIPLVVTSCNVFVHKEGTALHAKLFSGPKKKKTVIKPKKLSKRQKQLGCKVNGDNSKQDVPCMQVCISDNKNNVDIILNKENCSEDAYCLVEVPIFADLHVDAYSDVEVSRLNCKDVTIETKGNINTKQIRCQKEVVLHSNKGSIRCDHVLMGSLLDLETKCNKSIFVDVATGRNMKVKTTDGDVSTNCVYCVNSLFETKNGYMTLKNVHKHTEVNIFENGFLEMIGTRAEFKLCCGNAGLNVQLAYAVGNSQITCNDSLAKVCISDKLAKSVSLLVESKSIKLDNTLKSLSKFISADKSKLEHKVKGMTNDTLTISSKGQVELCQLMWIDKLITDIKKKMAKGGKRK